MSSDSNINRSPDRYTFQKEGYIERCKEEGKEPNPAYIEMYDTYKQQAEENARDPNWQKDNMEYDLRSTKWICDKVKASDTYAQNLYAAMCNMEFIKLDVMPILKNQRWSCSWRHAGGIIADMQEKGDYIDWYCSGIGSADQGYGIAGITPAEDSGGRTYVGEGVVTEEVQKDLQQLGWVPVEYEDEE